jgi:hypothetical protein
MKNRKSWQALLKVFILLAFITIFTTGNSAPHPQDFTCPVPTISVSGQSSGTISFAWNKVTGTTVYAVWYIREEDSYTSEAESVTGNAHTFTNLPTGTYQFYFETVCDSDTPGWVVVEELIF